MDPGRKIALISIFLIFFLSPCWAKEEISFRETVAVVRKALLDKNMPVLYRHIDISGIVSGKIKKLSSRATKQNSLAAKAAGNALKLSEPVLSKLAVRFIIKEYSASLKSLRQSYLNSLRLSKIGEKDRIGYAYGSFMGQPGTIAAVKTGGVWVITGVESPIIDQELSNLVKILSRSRVL